MISEGQLEIWSHQGATKPAKAAHEVIRSTINSFTNWRGEAIYEAYLQGSYRNHTNIRGNSDVDLVLQMTSAAYHDFSLLPFLDQLRLYLSLPAATYGWREFRYDVLTALHDGFGSDAVSIGRKSLKVATGHGTLPADVVVSTDYRRYLSSQGNFLSGMAFYVPSEWRWVVNFPKDHYNHGTAKNQATNSWYKSTIRVFKNMRRYGDERGLLEAKWAPSYFIECLLYNVPNQLFGGSFQQTMARVLDYLLTADIEPFVCQNGILPVFGSSHEQWSPHEASRFLHAILHMWRYL